MISITLLKQVSLFSFTLGRNSSSLMCTNQANSILLKRPIWSSKYNKAFLGEGNGKPKFILLFCTPF